MKQFRMTEERPEFTRADVARLLENAPSDPAERESYMKTKFEEEGLNPEEVEKLLSDLDSY